MMKTKHDRSQNIINKFTDEIIERKSMEINQNADNGNKIINDNDVYSKSRTVIEILLGHFNEMSHEQIRDEIVTIMIGK